MKRILLALCILAFSLPARAEWLDEHISEFSGIWSITKRNGGAEAKWAKELGGWQLFLIIKQESNNRLSIGMFYALRKGLIPLSVFNPHVADGSLVVMSSFVIPGETEVTATQYCFPLNAGTLSGNGDYYEVHEVIAGPDGETDSESVSGKFIFRKTTRSAP